MTIIGESNCEDEVDNLIASEVDITVCWVRSWEVYSEVGGADEADEDNLDLDFPSSLVVSLFVIAYISRLKLFIIAYKALIVIGDSAIATWFVDILLNNRII